MVVVTADVDVDSILSHVSTWSSPSLYTYPSSLHSNGNGTPHFHVLPYTLPTYQPELFPYPSNNKLCKFAREYVTRNMCLLLLLLLVEGLRFERDDDDDVAGGSVVMG